MCPKKATGYILLEIGEIMYEPTEREIGIEICKALNKIEEKLNWILGAAIAIVILLFARG